MNGVLIVAVLFSVGCRRSSATEATVDAAIATTAAPVASAASAPTKVVAQKSFADIPKAGLNECVDLALVDETGVAAQATLDAKLDESTKTLAKGLVPIKKPCEEQFADRTALASCFLSKVLPDDAGVPGAKLAVLASYYSVNTLADDAYMKDCLKVGGEWEAAKRDDPEAARERLRQRAQAIQDLAEKASSQ